MQQLQPNTTLQGGKYRIEKLLGQGGFGITYLAEQCLLKKRVAIKEFFIRDCVPTSVEIQSAVSDKISHSRVR